MLMVMLMVWRVAQWPSEFEKHFPGHIAKIVQSGFVLIDRLHRFATCPSVCFRMGLLINVDLCALAGWLVGLGGYISQEVGVV